MTYTPRRKPLIPANHEFWLAVARHPRPAPGVNFQEFTTDQQIEWLLQAITAPGADQNQRHVDLRTLAALVIADPVAGYGQAPIDGDCHDHDCGICRGITEDPIFDGHPYTYEPLPQEASCPTST